MASGIVPKPESLILGNFTNYSMFCDNAYNLLILRGVINTTDFLQLIFNSTNKEITLARKLNNGAEETLATWKGY